MTRLTWVLLCIITLTLSTRLYGQGRVDTDPILHNIWWTVQQVDQNDHLQMTVQTDNNPSGRAFKIFFYHLDTLLKASELTKTSSGTQLTSYYFDKAKPVYISVDRNNFKLSTDAQDINKAILSFDKQPDTSGNQRPLYLEQYSASYYFHKSKVRFTSVVTYSANGLVKNVRHDNKSDISRGLKLYLDASKYKQAK